MERLINTSMWAALSITDSDAEPVDAEDIFAALAEPALNDDSSLAEEMAATAYPYNAT